MHDAALRVHAQRELGRPPPRRRRGKTTGAAAEWTALYNIAIGVAQGICYLHHDCDPVIVHRDLKPSNILLDGDFEARVADFGVAKLVQTDESMSVVAGSYGYIAPGTLVVLFNYLICLTSFKLCTFRPFFNLSVC